MRLPFSRQASGRPKGGSLAEKLAKRTEYEDSTPLKDDDEGSSVSVYLPPISSLRSYAPLAEGDVGAVDLGQELCSITRQSEKPSLGVNSDDLI